MTHMITYETSISLPLIGRECSLRIYADYTPEQPEIIHPVDSSQEGIPEELELIAAILVIPAGGDVTSGDQLNIYYWLTSEDKEMLLLDILNDKENWS